MVQRFSKYSYIHLLSMQTTPAIKCRCQAHVTRIQWFFDASYSDTVLKGIADSTFLLW
jgi:hypothetical protein